MHPPARVPPPLRATDGPRGRRKDGHHCKRLADPRLPLWEEKLAARRASGASPPAHACRTPASARPRQPPARSCNCRPLGQTRRRRPACRRWRLFVAQRSCAGSLRQTPPAKRMAALLRGCRVSETPRVGRKWVRPRRGRRHTTNGRRRTPLAPERAHSQPPPASLLRSGARGRGEARKDTLKLGACNQTRKQAIPKPWAPNRMAVVQVASMVALVANALLRGTANTFASVRTRRRRSTMCVSTCHSDFKLESPTMPQKVKRAGRRVKKAHASSLLASNK